MIRMSSNQFAYNYKITLNEAYSKQEKLMEQGDGGKLHRPSDNAVDYAKLLRYNISDNENKQYGTNVQTALSWMKTADAAAVQMTEIQKNFKGKTTAAANSYNSDTDMLAIGKEMMSGIQEIVALGNSQQGDRYLFSGQADLTQPFSLSTEPVTRGLAKTLDAKQKGFFNDVDGTGSVTQMLTLDGSDGKTYYLNTLTGNIYSKDFMDNGYKDKVAIGQAHVSEEDALSPKNENQRYSHVGASLSDYGITPSADFLSELGATEGDFVTLNGGQYVGDTRTGKVYTATDAQSFATGGNALNSVGTYPSADFQMTAKVSGASSDYKNYNAASDDFAAAFTPINVTTANQTAYPGSYCAFGGWVYDAANGNPVVDTNGNPVAYPSTDFPQMSSISRTNPIPAGIPGLAYTTPPTLTVLQDNNGDTFVAVTQAPGTGTVMDIYPASYASGFTGAGTTATVDPTQIVGQWDSSDPNGTNHTTTSPYREVEAGLYVVEYEDANGVTQTGYADPDTGMIKSSALKTTPTDLATYQSSGGATGTWLNSDVNWLDPTVVGDLYATNEKYSFDKPTELTSNQKNYFGEDIFIHVTDDTGNSFYYSPTTRKVYTQQLMDDVDNGTVTGTVKDSDAVDDMRAMSVSANFKNTGEIKEDSVFGTGWSTDRIVNGRVLTMTLSTIQQQIATYSGDSKHISMVKINGSVDPTSDTVNMTGQDLFGSDIFDDANSGNLQSGTAMLNNMLTVYQQTVSSNYSWLSSDGMTLADGAHAVTLTAESRMGARAQLYDSVAEMLTTQGENITADITRVSSTDVGKLAIDLMEQQTLYNLSLSLGARVIPQSLADYL